MALMLLGCSDGAKEQRKAAPLAAKPVLVISKRAGSIRQFPCMKCHNKVTPRALKMPLTGKHEGMTFKHYEDVVACYTCHDKGNMDRLRLLAGPFVSFDESYKVCGQCHGEKLRDWKIGAHGKHVGSWAAERHRYSCTDCHDPHKPGPIKVKALPAPTFPRMGIPRTGGH